MTDGVERSPSGAPIIHHEPRMVDREIVMGDGEAIEKIDEHIEKHVGKVHHVLHEIVSELVHVDIHVVYPTPRRNYYTLVTSGMSDKPMAVPEGAEGMAYAELILCLPPDWSIEYEDFKREENYWPVRTLKILARLPHECDTWLGIGHTMGNGDPPRPYASNTRMCCALIAIPLRFPEAFWSLDDGLGKRVFFYSVIPIYREEMDLKLKRGSEALDAGFEKAGVTELLDPGRKNTCRRKFLGLF